MFFTKVENLCLSKGTPITQMVTNIGLSSSNVTSWKNGSIPRISTIKKIADYFNVPIEYFLEDAETIIDQPLPSNAYAVSSEVMSVPVIGRIPAGSPVIAIENIEGYEVVPKKWLNGDPQNYFVLRVDGDSMKDAGIFDGDLVLVKRCTTCDNGQICAVGITGDTPDLYATLKRVFMIDEEYVELVPENNKYPRRKVKRSEVNIFGIVKKSMRNF